MESKNKKKKKFNFKQKKETAIKSLAEVNCFLSQLNVAFNFKKIITKNK